MSNHIEAKKGEIAEAVLLPGDPLRAKYIAEKFLENPVCYNHIRNMFGYTGTYKGKKITVQGTGMGIPSISIYAHELICDYGAKKLIRVGTCGGLKDDVHVRDVVIAQGTTTDSGIVVRTFGAGLHYAPLADFELLGKAYHNAKKMNIPVKVGNVYCQGIHHHHGRQTDDIPSDGRVGHGSGVQEDRRQCRMPYCRAATARIRRQGKGY